MATATYASTITADSTLNKSDTTYTPDGGTATVGNPVNNTFGTFWDFNNPNYSTEQAFFGFDLTAPTTGDAPTGGATITGVTLTLNLNSHGSTEHPVEVYAYDWSTAVEAADWRTVAQLATLYSNALVASYTIPSGWGGAEGAHDFTSSGAAANSAVTSAIGGTLRLLITSSGLRNGSTPTDRGYASWVSADSTTQADRPLLTITYTAPAVWSGLIVIRDVSS